MSDERFPILMYHSVDKVNRASSVPGHYVDPVLFKKQMRLMKRLGYQAIPLIDAATLWAQGKRTPEKTFAISFDDGLQNFHTHAMPVLSDVQFPSTVFLVTSLIGRTNEWNRTNNDVEEPLMSVSQIKEAKGRLTDFGSHTQTHANLSVVGTDQAWKEISESKRDLESLLGEECPLFCYPYGGYLAETREMVAKAGYRAACSTLKGVNDGSIDKFLLRRINVRSDTIIPVFLYKLLRAKARNR